MAKSEEFVLLSNIRQVFCPAKQPNEIEEIPQLFVSSDYLYHFPWHPNRSSSVMFSHNKLDIEVFFKGIILILYSNVLQKYLVSILIGFIVDAGRNWIVPFSVWLVVGHLLSGEYVGGPC